VFASSTLRSVPTGMSLLLVSGLSSAYREAEEASDDDLQEVLKKALESLREKRR